MFLDDRVFIVDYCEVFLQHSAHLMPGINIRLVKSSVLSEPGHILLLQFLVLPLSLLSLLLELFVVPHFLSHFIPVFLKYFRYLRFAAVAIRLGTWRRRLGTGQVNNLNLKILGIFSAKTL